MNQPRALVVVDVQNDFVEGGSLGEALPEQGVVEIDLVGIAAESSKRALGEMAAAGVEVGPA